MQKWIVPDDHGSMLTKGILYHHICRADARHKISCRKQYDFSFNLYNPTAYEWHGQIT